MELLNREIENDDVKNRLLDAAEVLFCEKGFDRTSVRELTTAAGCNVAAVNYYFGGKDKLYAEMFRRQFGMMIQGNLDSISRVMEGPEPTLEKLLYEVIGPPVRRVAQNERGGQVMRLFIREVLNMQIAPESIAKDMKTKFFDHLGRAIVQFVPELAEENILMVVFSFDGVVLHPFLFINFYRKMMPDLDTEVLIHHMVRFVAAAIRGYAKTTEGTGQ